MPSKVHRGFGFRWVGLWVGIIAVAGPSLAQEPLDRAGLKDSCEAGEGDACGRLAEGYFSGEGAPKDVYRAGRFFGLGCDLDHGFSCFRLGQALVEGRGMTIDRVAAIPVLLKACELGEGAACREAGDLYTMGVGTRPDGQTAGLWYQLGCDLKDGESCANAGLWLERGDGLNPEPEMARDVWTKGCDWGSGRSCTLLGIRLWRGLEGAERDLQRGGALFAQGCRSGDAEGCRLAGEAVLKGQMAAPQEPETYPFLRQGCVLQDVLSCRLMVNRSMMERQYETAMWAGERACEMGDSRACNVAERAGKRQSR